MFFFNFCFTETYDILLLHAEEDRDFAMELREQLVKNSISDTCTRFLDVILIEEFIPEVQSEISTIEYVFKRCKYLFVLVTSNLKDDPRKRFLGELALIESIQNRRDGVIPIWAERGARNLIFELKPFKGIDCIQKQINFQQFSSKGIISKMNLKKQENLSVFKYYLFRVSN